MSALAEDMAAASLDDTTSETASPETVEVVSETNTGKAAAPEMREEAAEVPAAAEAPAAADVLAQAEVSAEAPAAAESAEGAAAGAVKPPKAAKKEKAASGAGRRSSNNVVVKVGMVGDAQIGKTSLMVKYIEGKFDEDYIQTLGVNFMEKSITIRNTEITFSIWDLGGQREFISMLPLVCNDAVATLFMFDLSNKASLKNVKEWYRQVRGMNKNSFAFLVGTKYDLFVKNFTQKEQESVTKMARKYAKAMKAPLIFSSASHSININKIFKIILSRVFNLKCTIDRISNVGDPILEY